MNDILSKSTGILLGTAVGDILGACVEGSTREAIVMEHGELREFMDTPRGFGCYTDDTQMTLALAHSLVECSGIDGAHCAAAYASFYQPHRGYGGGAHSVLQALKGGADYQETGHLIFKDGSFANGGAMRIAPLGLVYRDATDEVLKKAVFEAVRCTHIHPEGVDGAVVQAKAAALLSKLENAEDFNPVTFLEALYACSTTSVMRENIAYLKSVLKDAINDVTAVRHLGNGIRASEAVSCGLLATVRYYAAPEEAVIKSVNYGGDTDTIGAMCGALMGALHGAEWLPRHWLDYMENEAQGKDYIIQLAQKLARVTGG